MSSLDGTSGNDVEQIAHDECGDNVRGVSPAGQPRGAADLPAGWYRGQGRGSWL
ncbi:hypothetical protein [Solicola gregarius]|uniref:Uncharacterized protein n=1 Tax=Solicola gregarius TaxID=2908642 RepID=A0AA46TM34_9ACTN|nr:hypothetical protein [Solicola gregarius]UYM07638.1 hypothetical protein L0C25_11375 [Solicola gregarius]